MHLNDLHELGLNKNEAKIYLALLHLGEAPANALMKATGFHRNIIYDNLEKLIERGLVTFIFHGKKRVFRPSKATALQEMLAQQVEEAQEQLQKAKALTGEIQHALTRQQTGFKATTYQGIKAIKEILHDVLEHRTYCGIGISNASVEVLGETYWKNFIQKVNQRKIKERLLLNSDFKKVVPVDMPKYTETRHLPEQVNLITEIMIYGKKVAIIIYTNPPIATVIESDEAVKSFLSYFETLWKEAR